MALRDVAPGAYGVIIGLVLGAAIWTAFTGLFLLASYAHELRQAAAVLEQATEAPAAPEATRLR